MPKQYASISEPLGNASRTLRWPDGAHCEIGDLAGFSRLLGEAGHASTAVVSLQAGWHWAISALLGLIALASFSYLFALPWAAEKIAQQIPESAISELSSDILGSLDERLLQASKLSPDRQQSLRARLAALLPADSGKAAEKLHFRSAKRMPPNAFALPSGDIIVFDSLVALADSDDEVLAVLAHEAGHVASRHGLRQMLQTTVVSTFITIYLGDVSSLASGVGALLLESRYSREFELEADRYGADVLRAYGLSPELLASMLEKLEDSRRGKDIPTSSLLSTHPETAERAAALRALAR